MQMLLDDTEIGKQVEKEIIAPTCPTRLVVHVKKEAKAKRIIFHSIRIT